MSEIGKPDLSVIIPSVNGWADLRGAVAALIGQTGDVAVEVIVVDRIGDSVRVPLRNQFPEARLLVAEPGITIPELRALGFAAARADVVGVIEDHVIVPPDWATQMLAAQRAGAQVVGGAVDNAADQRLMDWACFLCEYSHCLIPPVGESTWVTGNNVTYRRELLERFRATIEEGKWENHLHDALRSAGVPLLSKPEIRVGHKKHYTLWEYLTQRYFYARSYAGMRVRGSGALRRAGYGGAAFALPPLLFYRIVSRVLAARVHRSELVRSLPLIALFVTSWATGEIMGYWRGDGNTLAKVC